VIRGADDEARQPKAAHIERERRWLVDPARRPLLADTAFVMVEDRYINKTRMRLRRMIDSRTGSSVLKLTKKYECDDPRARPIVTAYLTEAEYAVCAELPGTNIVKRRYPVDAQGIVYSLDCFGGALQGLELAEIEWPDDAGLRTLIPPNWTVRDVSDDPRYQGGTLARNGIPKE
jgi:CYTH domain-containing protein